MISIRGVQSVGIYKASAIKPLVDYHSRLEAWGSGSFKSRSKQRAERCF